MRHFLSTLSGSVCGGFVISSTVIELLASGGLPVDRLAEPAASSPAVAVGVTRAARGRSILCMDRSRAARECEPATAGELAAVSARRSTGGPPLASSSITVENMTTPPQTDPDSVLRQCRMHRLSTLSEVYSSSAPVPTSQNRESRRSAMALNGSVVGVECSFHRTARL